MHHTIAADTASTTPGRKLRAFVSYSRHDLAFADRLVAALESRGLEIMIDRRDLPSLEEWERELLTFIRLADTVIFIVSQHSLSSKVCAWEVEQVRLHGKRLAPVVIESISQIDVPKEIARINYLHFTNNALFETRADELARALNTDIFWLKEHTRLGELARRWRERSLADDALIRGQDLADAASWALRQPREAPPVTEHIRDFLAASQYAENQRLAQQQEQIVRTRRFQKRAAYALGIALATVVIGGWLAISQANQASEKSILIMAQRAKEAYDDGHHDRAMRYAIAGLPPPGSLPWESASTAEADLLSILSRAAVRSKLICQVPSGAATFTNSAISPDGARVAVVKSGNRLELWDCRNQTLVSTVAPFESSNGLYEQRIVFTPNNQYLAAAQSNKIEIFDAKDGRAIRTIDTDDHAARMFFSPDGDFLITDSYTDAISVYATKKWSLLYKLNAKALSVDEHSIDDRSNLLVYAPGEGKIVLHDIRKNRQVKAWNAGSPDVYSPTLSPDGKWAATINSGPGAQRSLRIWSLTEKLPRNVATITSEIVSARFLSDSNTILALKGSFVDIDGFADLVYLYRASDGTELARLRGHRQRVHSVDVGPIKAFTAPKGEVASIFPLVSLDESGVAFSRQVAGIKLDSPLTSLPEEKLSGGSSPISKVRLVRGSSIAFVASQRSIRLFEVFDGGAELHLPASGFPGSMHFSADGRRAVALFPDGAASVWDTHTKRVVGAQQSAAPKITEVKINQSGSRVLLNYEDKAVGFWNLLDGKVKKLPLKPGDSNVGFFMLSMTREAEFVALENTVYRWTSDGLMPIATKLTGDCSKMGPKRLLVTSPDYGSHQFWETSNDRKIADYRPPSGFHCSKAVMDRDERKALLVGSDRLIFLTLTSNAVREVRVVPGVFSTEFDPEFSDDGTRVVVQAGDGSVQVHRVDGKEQHLTFSSSRGSLLSATFTPGGSRLLLVYAGRAQAVILLDLPSKTQILDAQRVPYAQAIAADGTRMILGRAQEGIFQRDFSEVLNSRGEALIDLVCRRKLAGAQQFTSQELEDRIVGTFTRNPCEARYGVLHPMRYISTTAR